MLRFDEICRAFHDDLSIPCCVFFGNVPGILPKNSGSDGRFLGFCPSILACRTDIRGKFGPKLATLKTRFVGAKLERIPGS